MVVVAQIGFVVVTWNSFRVDLTCVGFSAGFGGDVGRDAELGGEVHGCELWGEVADAE